MKYLEEKSSLRFHAVFHERLEEEDPAVVIILNFQNIFELDISILEGGIHANFLKIA